MQIMMPDRIRLPTDEDALYTNETGNQIHYRRFYSPIGYHSANHNFLHGLHDPEIF